MEGRLALVSEQASCYVPSEIEYCRLSTMLYVHDCICVGAQKQAMQCRSFLTSRVPFSSGTLRSL